MFNKKIAIHGLGYLGYTTLSLLVDNYKSCYVCDYKEKRRESLESLNLLNEFFDNLFLSKNRYKPKQSLVNFCSQEEIFNIDDVDIHLICISTENEGIPDIVKFEKILDNIKILSNPVHIIIESTLYPSMIESKILPIVESKNRQLDQDYLLSFVVRQDLIKSVDDLSKDYKYIISGMSEKSINEANAFYRFLNKQTVVTPDYKALEIVKHIENSLEQVHQSFANQIALSFPNYNIDELFDIVYRHISVNLSPSLGSNGFALPVSSRILIDSISNPNSLSILKESILVDMSMITVIKNDLLINNLKSVLVLGISSENDIKQHIFSTYLRLVDYLVDSNIEVSVYDPYFKVDELKSLCKANVVESIDNKLDIDGIIVGSKHSWMKFLDIVTFIENFGSCKYFLDNGSFFKLKDRINNYKSISEINCSEVG